MLKASVTFVKKGGMVCLLLPNAGCMAWTPCALFQIAKNIKDREGDSNTWQK